MASTFYYLNIPITIKLSKAQLAMFVIDLINSVDWDDMIDEGQWVNDLDTLTRTSRVKKFVATLTFDELKLLKFPHLKTFGELSELADALDFDNGSFEMQVDILKSLFQNKSVLKKLRDYAVKAEKEMGKVMSAAECQEIDNARHLLTTKGYTIQEPKKGK